MKTKEEIKNSIHYFYTEGGTLVGYIPEGKVCPIIRGDTKEEIERSIMDMYYGGVYVGLLWDAGAAAKNTIEEGWMND